ncbi:Uncharacterised protein [Klebsiella pneumoniae]|uniref:Uncharacterized protein n=1 Tax=Klebsiella pneumoniae TaxID=573 RepID=A0A3S4H495_KLEPN|nr:Uncharacterised protein [Klebsiella pneumoniae]
MTLSLLYFSNKGLHRREHRAIGKAEQKTQRTQLQRGGDKGHGEEHHHRAAERRQQDPRGADAVAKLTQTVAQKSVPTRRGTAAIIPARKAILLLSGAIDLINSARIGPIEPLHNWITRVVKNRLITSPG